MIYFVRAGENGPIKIGHANDVASRIATMQSGNHETLILVREIEGDTRTERALHKRFVDYHIAREWFHFCPGMLTVDGAELDRNARLNLHHARVVDDLGGAIALSGKIGVKADTIRRWRLNGKIPAEYWAAIQMASANKFTIEELARTAPKDRRAA